MEAADAKVNYLVVIVYDEHESSVSGYINEVNALEAYRKYEGKCQNRYLAKVIYEGN